MTHEPITLADEELTDEEEARIQAGIAADPDNPELTNEELRELRPLAEVLPDHAAAIRETLAQRELTQEQITIHVDRDVVAAYKDGGPGWRERMNEALKQGLAAAPKET